MTPELCKAARALTGLTQKDLAEAACIATPTIADFERGARKPHANNIKSITNVFENRGLDFIEENGEIIGMKFNRLKKS